ncbi:hypothetical protein J2S20_002402 [Moryella indoligenes]|uniref:Uncharacterized protein n=1 Tax=Moryella indoligenes TaxID=371674 RepID=A0AAE3VCY7_9FIRM|nr:hypothetical protein [Moryella indoligenes]MDQ0153680.1 hypothetical protein [Moryella indoligenes]
MKIKAWTIVLGALILADQIRSQKKLQYQMGLTAQAFETQAKINQKIIDILKPRGHLDSKAHLSKS